LTDVDRNCRKERLKDQGLSTSEDAGGRLRDTLTGGYAAAVPPVHKAPCSMRMRTTPYECNPSTSCARFPNLAGTFILCYSTYTRFAGRLTDATISEKPPSKLSQATPNLKQKLNRLMRSARWYVSLAESGRSLRCKKVMRWTAMLFWNPRGFSWLLNSLQHAASQP
jgi:hypothetical protein